MNSLIYYKRNKKKAAIIFCIIFISVFSISLVRSLIQSVYSTAKDAMVNPFNQFSLMRYSGNSPDMGESEISSLDDVSFVCSVGVINTSIRTVFGTTSSYILLSDDQEIIASIVRRCNLELLDNTIDELQENGIIMHEDILLNKELKLGDRIGSFRIAGRFRGDVKLSLGYLAADFLPNYIESKTYLLFPKEGRLEYLNQSINSFSDKDWEVISRLSSQKTLDEEFHSINTILSIVVVLVSFCVSIALAALVYTMYSNRYDEFAILNAIGYTKRTIQKCILKEISLISISSWLCGYLLSLTVLLIVDVLIYKKMGQSMQIITVGSITFSILLPVLVLLCAALPISHKLSKTDLVSVIERR